MQGIVLNSKSQGREDPRYCIFLTGEKRVISVRSSVVLKPGETIRTNDSEDTIRTVEVESNPSGMQELEDFSEQVSDAMQGKSYLTGDSRIDKVTVRMWERLRLCGYVLLRKLALAAPIIVRFHNDADGSSGAYGLYRSIGDLSERKPGIRYRHNISWIMQQSVSYSAYDAGTDMMIANSYSSVEKPLLVMIDFGTAMESNSSIEQVKDKFDIIWMDHHPVVEGFRWSALENYVNPWNFGGDSNYAAGFLTCVFSKTFSSIDTKEIENASLVGDCSLYAPADSKGADLSLLLDLITSDPKVAFGPATPNVTPYEIDKLVADEGRRAELVGFAKMRLSEVMDIALKSMKRYRGESAAIYVLDFEGLRDEQSKYPLPGRFSSRLLDKVAEIKGEPCIVVVHSGRFISMRVSRELSGKVDLAAVIASIKESYAELIEAGGGHMLASGIKLADKAEKAKVIREIVLLLKKQLAADPEPA